MGNANLVNILENYNKDNDIGFFFFWKLIFRIQKNYMNFIMKYLFTRLKIEKVEKHVASLQDKKEYLIHMKKLKQTLNYKLVLEKVHTVIRFNQEAWLKPYININKELRKLQNMISKKIF